MLRIIDKPQTHTMPGHPAQTSVNQTPHLSIYRKNHFFATYLRIFQKEPYFGVLGGYISGFS